MLANAMSPSLGDVHPYAVLPQVLGGCLLVRFSRARYPKKDVAGNSLPQGMNATPQMTSQKMETLQV